MSGNRLTRTAAILFGDYLTETFQIQTATTDIQQRTYDGAHHIAQKTIGSYLKPPIVWSHLHPTRVLDVTDIGLDVRM